MKITPLIALIFCMVTLRAQAADECKKGSKSLHPGEPCIPEVLFNYLYCLSNSGNGKIEVVHSGDDSSDSGVEVKATGEGRNLVLSGKVGASYKKDEATRLVKLAQEKLDPNLVTNCRAIAEISNNSTSSTDAKAPRSEQRAKPNPPSAQQTIQTNDIDFVVDSVEITEQSLAYLKKLSKYFLRLKDARITLSPEYRTQSAANTDVNSANKTQSISFQRSLAVRTSLVKAGFVPDNISIDNGSAHIFGNASTRYDINGREIESGIFMQAWP